MLKIDRVYLNKIMEIKTVCSFISFFSCSFIIYLYIRLYINILKKKEKKFFDYILNSNNNDDYFISTNSQRNKIGLGNHFFFYLIIGNFFGSFFEGIFTKFFKTSDDIEDNSTCIFFAVMHNLFDIWNVCWTTMITFLFFQTSKSHIKKVDINEIKLKKIGFIYLLFSIIIITIFPLIINPKKYYGNADIYCSFKLTDKENIFNLLLILLIFGNLIINIYFLYKSQNFYSKKLLLLKAQNNIIEFKVVRIVKYILITFIFILAFSRIFKGLSRIGISGKYGKYDIDLPDWITIIFLYLGTIMFSLTGFFNALISVYFFRSVLCCNRNYHHKIIDEENQINIDGTICSEND